MTALRIGPPASGTTEVEVDGRVHVYSPTTQQLVALNETASDVWRLCDGEHTTDDIVDRLSRSYQVDPDVVRQDVHGVLAQFVTLALLPAPDTA